VYCEGNKKIDKFREEVKIDKLLSKLVDFCEEAIKKDILPF